MNGEQLLLDTNAVIVLLQGDRRLIDAVAAASWVGVSVITQLEALSYPSLSSDDAELLARFFARIDVVNLTVEQPILLETIVGMRQNRVLKLPDAIVAASAVVSNAILVTADKELIRRTSIKHWDFTQTQSEDAGS
jgi:predicted nucleic acid-binding protein